MWQRYRAVLVGIIAMIWKARMWDFRMRLASVLCYSAESVTYCISCCHFRKDKMEAIKNLIYAFLCCNLLILIIVIHNFFNYYNNILFPWNIDINFHRDLILSLGANLFYAIQDSLIVALRVIFRPHDCS